MRVALIGYGYWGKFAARAIARVAELSWVVEKDAGARHQAALDWQGWGTRVADDVAQCSSDVDAVWVATPTVTHREVVRDTLGLGLHVLCEKPFVRTRQEAESLVDQARESHLALMVGHLTLYMRERNRCITDALVANDSRHSLRAVRKNTEASLSDGSVLFGIGPHEIAPLVRVAGEPDEVECFGTLHRVTATMKWPSLVADVELDWLSEKRERVLSIDGQLQQFEETSEPLVNEMEAFAQLPDASSLREEAYLDALRTTATLEELERRREQT
jgi:predicted dehydrogenase